MTPPAPAVADRLPGAAALVEATDEGPVPPCVLVVFGADGLVTRWERFDPGRAADAIARFDGLAAEPPRVGRRRLSPNLATSHAERFESAIAARRMDEFPALVAENAEMVEHTTGITYDRAGIVATLRMLLSAQSPSMRIEPIASRFRQPLNLDLVRRAWCTHCTHGVIPPRICSNNSYYRRKYPTPSEKTTTPGRCCRPAAVDHGPTRFRRSFFLTAGVP